MAARYPNKFEDPKGGKTTYEWLINHNEEEASGKRRNITRSANTDGTGLVRQQGDDSPLVFKWSGTMLHNSQVKEMAEWMELSRTQTIYLEDFANDKYEVIITAFEPKRIRTMRNPRASGDPERLYYWTYTIELEVIRVRDGIWEGTSP